MSIAHHLLPIHTCLGEGLSVYQPVHREEDMAGVPNQLGGGLTSQFHVLHGDAGLVDDGPAMILRYWS